MSRVRHSWFTVLLIGLLLIPVDRGEAQAVAKQRDIPLHMLNLEPVRKEIDLGEDQQEKIAKIQGEVEKTRTELFKAYEAAKKALSAERDEDDATGSRRDERAQQLEAQWRELQMRAGRDQQVAVRKALRPEQVRRLLELDLRERGTEAFTDPALAAILNIDEAKFIEIQGIVQQSKEALRLDTVKFIEATRKAMPKREDGTYDREKYAERLANDPALRKSIAESRESLTTKKGQVEGRATQKILSVLTRRQRETYIKLLGEPFDTTKLIRPLPGGPAPTQEPAPEAKPVAQKPATRTLREQRGVPN